RTFLTELCAGPMIARPPDAPWDAMIARTSQPGVICAIDEDTYDYFLEVLPPKYQGHGFAFAEGAEPRRYSWRLSPPRYFCPELKVGDSRARDLFARFDSSLAKVCDPQPLGRPDHIQVWTGFGTTNARKEWLHCTAQAYAISEEQAWSIEEQRKEGHHDAP